MKSESKPQRTFGRAAAAAALVLVLPAIASAASIVSPECDAANVSGIKLLDAERVTEAEAWFSSFLAKLDDSPGTKLCKAVTLTSYGQALDRLGKWDEAERAGRRAIDLMEQLQGKDYSPLHRPLQLLVGIALEKGQYAKGERLLGRAEALPGPGLIDLANESGFRAVLESMAERYPEAERSGRRSVEHWEQAGFGDSLSIVPELANLGTVLILQHRHRDAIPVLERCLSILRRSPDSPAMHVRALVVAAVAQANAGDRSTADGYYSEAVSRLPTVPVNARSEIGRQLYAIYADFLRKTGRKRDAKAADEQARTIGPDPSSVVVDVNSLMPKPRTR